MLGHANHFLITILVGLDAVGSGHATLSAEFSTSWDPRDAEVSALRSREFALEAVTAWSVDALDTYRRLLTSESAPYLSRSMRVSVESEDGLRLRLRKLFQVSGALPAPEVDMTEMLIVWRNKLVHSGARDSVPRDVSARLLAASEDIASAYRNLDVKRTIESVTGKRSPTFKEATAFVTAAHRFVERVDGAVIARVDLDACLRAALVAHIADDPINRCRSIWVPDQERRRNSILQVAQNFGLAPGGDRTVSHEFALDLMSWTPKDARRELAPGLDP